MFRKISIFAAILGLVLLVFAALPKTTVQAESADQLPPPTRTRTATPRPTASRRTLTPTTIPTITKTPTPTRTPPVPAACSPVDEVIPLPTMNKKIIKDGAGTFCWQVMGLNSFVVSWNLYSLTINGWDYYTNVYVPLASLPPKVNDSYYIRYHSNFSWGHMEAY